jgi:hypothetical protein
VRCDLTKTHPIQHTANPGFYYILFRGDNPVRIIEPVDLKEPFGSSGILIDPSPPPHQAYYRVLEVSLDAPLDTDGEGLTM